MPPTDEILSYAVPDERTTMSRSRRFFRFGKTWLLSPTAAIVGLLVGVGVSQAIALGVANGVASLIVTTALCVVIGACLRSIRAIRARRVLVYVERAVRLSMPMPEFLRASAAAEDRFVAARLRGVADAIAGGGRLGDALRNEVPELPLRTVGLIRAAADNDALPATLARLCAEDTPSAERAAQRQLPLVYFAMMIVALPAALVLYGVFVMPKWAQILHDFRAPPPPWFGWVQAVGEAWFALLIAATLLAAAIVVALVSRSFRWIFFGRSDLIEPRGTLIGRIAWRVPIAGAMSRDRAHADACQTVADGLAHRRPLDAVLADAGMLKLNAVLLERLRVWRLLSAGGTSLGEAARVARMPSLISGLVGARRSAEAFAFLARHYRGRAERRGEWLVAFAMPTMTLAFALAVGAIAYGLFDMITRLIDIAAPYPVRI